jgi:hypothetical protein
VFTWYLTGVLSAEATGEMREPESDGPGIVVTGQYKEAVYLSLEMTAREGSVTVALVGVHILKEVVLGNSECTLTYEKDDKTITIFCANNKNGTLLKVWL